MRLPSVEFVRKEPRVRGKNEERLEKEALARAREGGRKEEADRPKVDKIRDAFYKYLHCVPRTVPLRPSLGGLPLWDALRKVRERSRVLEARMQIWDWSARGDVTDPPIRARKGRKLTAPITGYRQTDRLFWISVEEEVF